MKQILLERQGYSERIERMFGKGMVVALTGQRRGRRATRFIQRQLSFYRRSPGSASSASSLSHTRSAIQ